MTATTHHRCLQIAALLVLTHLSRPSAAQEYPGAGETRIVGSNMVSARERALAIAQRDAVSRATAAMVSEEQLAAHSAALNDSIYRRHSEYVGTYRVVHEEQVGPLFRISIAAQVKEGRLRADVRRLMEPLGGARAGDSTGAGAGGAATAPHIAVLMLSCSSTAGGDEQQCSQAIEATVSATGQLLERQGFAKPRALPGTTWGARGVGAANVGLLIAISLAEADGVRGIGLRGGKADVSLSVQPRDGGASRGAISVSEYGVGEDLPLSLGDAVARALREVLLQLEPILAAQFPRRMTGVSHLLRIGPLTSTSRFAAVQRALQERVAGVRAAVPNRFAEGSVWFALSTSEPLEKVVANLEALSFDGFRLKRTQVDAAIAQMEPVELAPVAPAE